MVSTSPTAAEAQAGEASALRAGDTGVLGRGSRQPQPSPHPRPLPAPSGLINVWPQRRESQEAKQKRTPLYCWGPGDASYLGRSPRPLRHTRHPGLPAHSLCDHRAHSPSLSLGFLICKVGTQHCLSVPGPLESLVSVKPPTPLGGGVPLSHATEGDRGSERR